MLCHHLAPFEKARVKKKVERGICFDLGSYVSLLLLLDVFVTGYCSVLKPFILVQLSLDIVGLLSANSGKKSTFIVN